MTIGRLKPKDITAIQSAIELLPVKKKWHLNDDGNKVKVVRKSENEYNVYSDGHYVNTEIDWQSAFEMVKALLK
jgi:hypothetical protein